MNREVIGLTVDTVSVISIGIGIGVSYAIFTLAAIRDELVGGFLLDEAVRAALRAVGKTVLSTYPRFPLSQ
jgi:predicted RND superfamily exporter protein